jgi:hypothetical protein
VVALPVSADDTSSADLFIRVQYPSDGEGDDDDEWLQDLTEHHGGTFPDVVMSSYPAQAILSFPDAESASAFRSDLTREGRLVIRKPFPPQKPKDR